MQEEIVGFEKDLSQSLKKQIECIQETTRKDVSKYKNELQRLQDIIHKKNETVDLLNH